MPAITTIKLRRGTAAQWTSANPVLAAGEIGLETDTRRTKYGNGSQAWSALPYSVADTSGVATVDWLAVTNKPATFPPSTHTHVKADITDFAHTHTSEELNWSYYNTFADLPSASTKHGMVAHVHSEGNLYFAHAGQWVLVSKNGHTHTISAITDYDRTAGTVLSDTAPVSPVAGLKWVKTTTMQQYIYFDSTWVEI